MQALREIHDVTLNKVTINIPQTFPFKRVEIVVLPMTLSSAQEFFVTGRWNVHRKIS
jgi:hypothetical protein